MTTLASRRLLPVTRANLGVGLVLASTVAIAVVPSFAHIAYDGGADVPTTIAARLLVSLAATGAALALTGQPARIAPAARRACQVAGVSYAVMLYGFLGAVEYLPANIVILAFYLHPLLVALVVAAPSGGRSSPLVLAASAVAFGGLALAVGAAASALPLTGLALALLAAIAATVVIVAGGSAARHASGLQVVFHTMLFTALTLMPLFPLTGALQLPVTASGWFGFAGVSVGSTIGTLAFFCAVPLIGTVRAALISNVEPLLGIAFSMALLGETLTRTQMLGCALVLGAILSVEVAQRR